MNAVQPVDHPPAGHTPPPALAVDIVLPAPVGVAGTLRLLNRELAPPPEGFHLDATHLPHITLLQQFVSRGRIDDLRVAVGDLLRDQPALELHTTTVALGASASTLGIAPSAPLVALHRRLARGLYRFVHQFERDTQREPRRAFVDDGEPVRTADIAWVREFYERSAYDRFDPHFTLGVGRLAPRPVAAAFTTDVVALCHLGRFCTCRRIIDSWTLTSRIGKGAI